MCLRLYKLGFVVRSLRDDPEGTDLIRKKVKGKHCAWDRNSKSIYKEFGSEDDQDEWFHVEEKPDTLVNHLRSEFQIMDGATLNDLFYNLRKYPIWNVLGDVLSPKFCYGDHTYDGDCPETLVLGLVGEISAGNLTFEPVMNASPNRQFLGDTPIELEETIRFIDLAEDDIVCEGDFCYSLMDVLFILGGGQPREQYYLEQNGLCELVNGVELAIEPHVGLLHPIQLRGQVTLADIFKMVEDDELLTSFIGGYSWCRAIKEFHEAAKQPPHVADDKDEEVFYCEVKVSGDISTYKGETGISIGNDFVGYGELAKDEKEYWDQHPEKRRPKYTRYSLSLSPMNTIAHLPVRLEDDFDIVEMTRGVKGDLDRLNCSRQLTLLDILDAIYWDISFHGGPQDAEDFKEELGDRVASCKHEMKRHVRLGHWLWNQTFARLWFCDRKGLLRYTSVKDMMKDLELDDE